MARKAKTEEFVLDSKDLVDKVKHIIKEGHARRIIIKNQKDEEMLTIPLTWAAVGTILAPVLAAVAAIATVVTKSKLVVEKKDDEEVVVKRKPKAKAKPKPKTTAKKK